MIAAVAEPAAGAAAVPAAAEPPDLVSEAVALADRSLIAAAEAALAEAEERFRAAKAEAADAAAGEARAAMPRLVELAVAGEEVAVKTIAGVRQRVRDAEAYSAFTAAVARRLAEAVTLAKAELDETRHQAWTPVLQRAIDMRIAAARKADRARLAAQWGRSHTPQQIEVLEKAKAAAYAAAQPEFDAANEIIRIAVKNGLRFPTNPHLSQPQWPSRELAERAFWGRPMTAKEFLDATAA